MNNTILNIEVQDFINKNINSDVISLLLKGSPFSKIEVKAIIEQIESKKRCKTKLPTWYSTPNIYYPNKLNIEQTSSEITAKYKSELIDGNSIIDLTGGFGVDCYYFSKRFNEVTHCELNEQLNTIVTHNYKQFQIDNIKTVNGDGLNYLRASNNSYDWIYLDPSRRHDSKGKVFLLKDCLPNIPKHLDEYFEKSNHILIKTSPLLDLSVGLNELKHVKSIYIIAVNNEVKELLWILEKDTIEDVSIKTVNIKGNQKEEYSFKLKEESNAIATYSHPLSYLYEPNVAILKSGSFNLISETYKVFKLHKHTHLYTSKELIDFPGRQFEIEKVLAYNKKKIKEASILKANISTRNFPETVQQIRKKFKIKDGGNIYLFFTTNEIGDKIVLLCSKVNYSMKEG